MLTLPFIQRCGLTHVLEDKLNSWKFPLQVNMYEDLGSYENLKAIMERILEQYNMEHKALEHVTRVMRTLTLPLGNSLLVGVGGSGKQSISRLAAFAASCGVFEITLSRGYDEASFREDLKVSNVC